MCHEGLKRTVTTPCLSCACQSQVFQADIPELEPEHVDPEPKLSRGHGGPKLTLFSLLLLLLLLLPIMISNYHQNISKP